MTDAELMKQAMLKILKTDEFDVSESDGIVWANVFKQEDYFHVVGQAMIRKTITWPKTGQIRWIPK